MVIKGSALLAFTVLHLSFEAQASAHPALAQPSRTTDRLTLVGVTVFDPQRLADVAATRARRAGEVASLEAIAGTIESHYREAGYLFAEAAVIVREDGSEAIAVDEGAVDRLEFSSSLPADVRRSVERIFAPALRYSPLHQASFERSLALASDLAGVQVQAEVRPEGEVNVLAITGTVRRQAGTAGLEVIPARPGSAIRAFVSQEIYGAAVTGDLLRLTGLVSREPRDSPSGALFGMYRVPVSAGGSYLEVYGGNVLGRRTFERDEPSYRLRGVTAGGLMGFVVRRDLHNFLYLIAETEYQRSRSRVGSLITQSKALSGRVHLTGGHDYARGGILRWAVTGSAGVRPEASLPTFTDGPRRFAHLRGDFGIVRVISKDSNSTIRFDARSQLTSTTLPEVERFTLGHAPFLRGYAPAEVEGDSGMSATLEFSRSFERAASGRLTSIAPFLFVSGGAAWLNDPRPSFQERRRRQIASVGVGTDVRWKSWQVTAWGALPLAKGPRTRAGSPAAYVALMRSW